MALGYFNSASTPEQLAARRQQLDDLASRIGGATNIGSGIGDIFKGLAVGFGRYKSGKDEKAGRASADQAWNAFNALGGPQISATSAPIASPGLSQPANQNRAKTGSKTPSMDIASQIYNGLMQRGLPDHVARATLGNMSIESGLDPGINELRPMVKGSRGGFGLNQWTGPRRRAFEAFAAERGVKPNDLGAQLDFTMHEFKGPESAAFRKLMATKNADQAAQVYSQSFLRPGIPHLDRRLAETRKYAGMDFGASQQPVQVASNDPGFMPQPASFQQPQPEMQMAQQQPEPQQAAPPPQMQPPEQQQQQPNQDRLQELINLANNPWNSPQQAQMAQFLLQQELKKNDPMNMLNMQQAQQELQSGQLGMEKTRLELDQMRNPRVDPLKLQEQQLNIQKLQQDLDTGAVKQSGDKFINVQTGQVVYDPGPKQPDPMSEADRARIELDRQKFAAEQDKPMVVGADSRLFGGGKVLLDAAPKRETLPAGVQEYEYAKRQGFKGTFQDWESSKRGGMQLQVDPATGAVTFQQGANIKPLTEGQSKDTAYAARAEGALSEFDPIADNLTGVVGNTFGQLPVIGNVLQDEGFQKAQQAGNNFLTALLRKESGATITPDEEKLYGDIFLPRMGDAKGTRAQKQNARTLALESIKAGMPPQAILAQMQALAKANEKKIPTQDDKSKRLKFNPVTGEFE